MNEEVKTSKRQRSSNYPSMDLEWAVDVVKKAHSQGTMNRTALAQLMGHQDDTSGPARSKLAALRHFSLINYEEGNVKITELGETIAAPMSNEDVNEALRSSFFSVAAFKQIYDLCAKNINLPKDTIVNTAIRQVKIVARVAKDFVDIFALSGKEAGLVEIIDDKTIKIMKEPLSVEKPHGYKKSDAEAPEHTPPVPPSPVDKAFGLQSLTINLQLTLPETTNSKVYEEIFKAMKEHLLESNK